MSRNDRKGRKGGKSHAAKDGKSSRFVFRDRTGKVHGKGGGASSSEESRPQPRREESRPKKAHSERKPSPLQKSRKPHPSHKRERPYKKERPQRGVRAAEGARLKATVDKNHRGFGFLIFEDRSYEDAFIPPREAEAFFHGDRVEVTIDSRGHVSGIEVLEHRFRELVGRFSPHPAGGDRGGWVIYERKRAREEIYIPNPDRLAKSGDWLKVKLEFHEKGQFAVTGSITENYGPELPPSADIGMVSAEYNLVEEHSKEAEQEARALTLEIPGRDLQGREDFRRVPFITIDGETARDFDDAVYVERKKSGFVLWVAIADVSHYVTDGTALDQEARSRGTSVYFPERAFHMLPRALSENLCSLKPNEPRLSMVAKMEFNRQGQRLSTELYEAVIESHRRATYNQIQDEWIANQKNEDWEFAPHFELYALIRKQRSDRGSIDFDLPEAEVKVEPTGEVISITQRGRLDAHRLIEEFMIAANEAVTDWMLELGWPFVYRVHEEPAGASLLKFQQLAATVGIHFSLEKEKSNSPKIMADLVRRLEGHPAQGLLNMALLRSLKQAIYSSTHGSHYGLASEGYTHFTSPIRRYPDLVVHRLLRWALRVTNGKVSALSDKDRKKLEEDLAEICEHCSYRERIAADAERESIKLKQVRAMIPQVGNDFDGEIVGMMEAGMFVKIPDPYCEGMISKDAMMDDFYEFNEDRMIFFGRRKRKTFKVGDKARVRALRADLDKRQVDFGFVSDLSPDGQKSPS